MGEFMTTHCVALGEGVSEADQPGKRVDEDTKVFAITHPPWYTISNRIDERLEGLNPPRQLTEDWNRNVAELGPYQTWEEIDFEKRYIQHIELAPPAEAALRKIKMLLNVGDVCLVCGDRCYDLCPRRLVYERIQENGYHK